MITINLATPSKSQVAFRIIEYSDTQTRVVIEDPRRLYLEDVRIVSRMSWPDLQNILQVVAKLRELKAQSIELMVPYFLGARSDRPFEMGSVNYMKRIICPIINGLKLDKVVVHDPHSMAIEFLDEVESIAMATTLAHALCRAYSIKSYIYGCPDEGAIKRTEEAGLYDGVPVVKCRKKREVTTGKILGFEVLSDDLQGANIILTDDICDGGATFIGLGEELKKKNAGDLYLAVTHGIFSKGFDELKKYYKGIITTNSFREFTPEEQEYVTVHRVL